MTELAEYFDEISQGGGGGGRVNQFRNPKRSSAII